MQCLITAIVAVILLVGAASSCPSACGCTDISDGVNVDCSRRGLDSIPTDLPNNTYVLELQYNDISVIENNTFNNLPRLYQLYLDNNKITSIKSDMFNNLTNLNWLRLQYNDISVIENNTFNNLPRLNQLELGNNNISVIENNAFNNLPRLQYLNLYSNKITSIKSDTFNNLTNLDVLQLQNNDISVIEDKAFNNLQNLQSLYLNYNKITSIKSDTINNLKNLGLLELQHNDISVIEDKAFNNLPNLQNLWMGYNPIAFVSEHAFGNLPQLTSLFFEMYCGGCENTPFWRWLKLNQRFSKSITCHDFDGQYLSNLQPNKFTDCCVHGNWSAWGAWSSCSETCGSGVLTRYRTCNNPPPANGGSYCQGNNNETTSCLTTPCPVHGNWGTWTEWNSCSLACGSGSRSRHQECNNPKPAYGGSHCQGNDTEIELCSIELCPVALEEDSSSAAIGIGACIGSTAVVVGLLIVFIYILKRYRLRKAAESAIYDTAGDTRYSKFRSTYIYDRIQPNTESPTH